MAHINFFEGLRQPHDPKSEEPTRDLPLYVNRPLYTDEEIERALTQELAA